MFVSGATKAASLLSGGRPREPEKSSYTRRKPCGLVFGQEFDSPRLHHVGASFISLAPAFYKSQSAHMPLLFLSQSNPLRWASIGFLELGQTALHSLPSYDESSHRFVAPPLQFVNAVLVCELSLGIRLESGLLSRIVTHSDVEMCYDFVTFFFFKFLPA